jgi:hypothetical protein
MHQLGKLLYIVERNRKITAVVGKQPIQEGTSPTPPMNARPVPRSASQRVLDPNLDIVSQRPVKIATGQSRGFPPPFPSRYSPQGSRVGPQGGLKQVTSKGANALQRVSMLASHPAPQALSAFSSDTGKFKHMCGIPFSYTGHLLLSQLEQDIRAADLFSASVTVSIPYPGLAR